MTGSIHRIKKSIMDAAKSSPCTRCGDTHPPFVMDLHHPDPSTKHARLAPRKRHANLFRLKLADLRVEIAQCEVVCANCHRYIENGAV